MDVNDYALELLVRDRLAEARRDAARRALRPPSRWPRSVRARIGHALIALGRALAGEPDGVVAPARPEASRG